MAASSQAVTVRNSVGLSVSLLLTCSILLIALAVSATALSAKLILCLFGVAAQFQCWKGQQLWPRRRLLHFSCRGNELDLLSPKHAAQPYFVSYHSEYLIMLEARGMPSGWVAMGGFLRRVSAGARLASQAGHLKTGALTDPSEDRPRVLVLFPDMMSKHAWRLLRRSALQAGR